MLIIVRSSSQFFAALSGPHRRGLSPRECAGFPAGHSERAGLPHRPLEGEHSSCLTGRAGLFPQTASARRTLPTDRTATRYALRFGLSQSRKGLGAQTPSNRGGSLKAHHYGAPLSVKVRHLPIVEHEGSSPSQDAASSRGLCG